jgi:hypothetical protein
MRQGVADSWNLKIPVHLEEVIIIIFLIMK